MFGSTYSRLDPSALPAAGKQSIITSLVENTRKPTAILHGEATFNRRAAKWMVDDDSRLGALPVERVKPRTPPCRYPEYRYTNADVEGACPQPYPGSTLAPRVRVGTGLSSHWQTTRKINPNVPLYDLPQGRRPEDCVTSPREGIHTLPTYQRVDKYPLTRDMLSGNNRDPCDHHDIEKSTPGTAYGLYPRKELRAHLDYSDVQRSVPGPFKHEATGHSSVYNGKVHSKTMVAGPGETTRRDPREPVDTAMEAKIHWRRTPTNPLAPNYQFDPVGSAYRSEMERSKQIRNSSSAVLERRQLQSPVTGEVSGRMERFANIRLRNTEKMEKNAGKGTFKHEAGVINMYLQRPFAPPVIDGWKY